MKSFGTLTTATIRVKRLADCPLKAEKDFKNEGRRSSSFRTYANSEIMLLRWFDNKSVQLASTFSSAAVSGFVKRWDATSKKYIQIIPCPELVKEDSSAMGVITWLTWGTSIKYVRSMGEGGGQDKSVHLLFLWRHSID